MSRFPVMVFAITLAYGWALRAQSNPLSVDAKADCARVRDYFIRAAEKMPEASYGFKPAPEVRSFGQLVPEGGIFGIGEYADGEIGPGRCAQKVFRLLRWRV